MLEPLIEGGGCLVGLALLLYFQVWRPSRAQARARAQDAAAQGPKAADAHRNE